MVPAKFSIFAIISAKFRGNTIIQATFSIPHIPSTELRGKQTAIQAEFSISAIIPAKFRGEQTLVSVKFSIFAVIP